MEPDLFMIDDAVDALSEERHAIVVGRALHRYGVTWELGENGWPSITDSDAYDLQAMLDNSEFLEIMADEYKRIIFQEVLDGLVAKGILVGDHVDEDGEVAYVLAPGITIT